ncbi:MAG: peptide deformylase [Chlamydiota bacterium]
MKLAIRYFGHPDLRMKAKPVPEINEEIRKIVSDMLETMLSMDNCIGFAGPQLGIPYRIFVIREEKMGSDNQYYLGDPEVIINPVLSAPSKELFVMQEGCMSLPGLHIEVVRPGKVHISYQTLDGRTVEEDVIDFRARMMMHENDHLNGTLTIDRMDPKERKKIEPLLREMKEKYNS